MQEIDRFGMTNLIGNAVLWNDREQKINKGTFYVTNSENRLYNILLDENIVKVDERTKKDDITEERIIRLDLDNNDYIFTLHNHEGTATVYTRFFSKKEANFGKLELSKEEFFEEIGFVIDNLENIEGLNDVFDIKLLKEYILDDLDINPNYKKL